MKVFLHGYIYYRDRNSSVPVKPIVAESLEGLLGKVRNLWEQELHQLE